MRRTPDVEHYKKGEFTEGLVTAIGEAGRHWPRISPMTPRPTSMSLPMTSISAKIDSNGDRSRGEEMKKMILLVILLFVVLAFAACQKSPEKLTYPVTKKVDQVDDYFGTKVADPYRWLEDDNAEDVKAWVQAENAVTFGYLDKIPFRPKIKARLTEIFNYPRYSSPFRAGEYYFFYVNDGLQNQPVCYIQKGLDGPPEAFLDPNTLSADGTIRASLIGPSNDDRYVAVSRGESGSDWSEIRVMDIATKQELPDRVLWVKFSGAAWKGDGFSTAATTSPRPARSSRPRTSTRRSSLHKLGDPQEKDVLVWQDKEHPLRYVGTGTTEDEKWLFLVVSEGTSGAELYVKDLTKKNAPFDLLVKGFAYDPSPIEVVDGKVLVQTNEDAPNFRVVLIDPKKAAKENWTTVIPEKPEVLTGAGTAGGYMFCTYLKDANSKIYQLKLDGTLVREIELPALGSAGGFGGKRDEKTLFYTFTSFTYPPTIYKFDPATGTSEVFRKSEVKFNPAACDETGLLYEQGRHQSADVHRPQGAQARRQESDLPHGLRRVQHQRHARLQRRDHHPSRERRRICRAEPPGRRRVRRGLAQGRHAQQEAERLR